MAEWQVSTRYKKFSPALKRAALKIGRSQVWWCTPLILAFRRHRQARLCEFKTSPFYTAVFRPTWVTQ